MSHRSDGQRHAQLRFEHLAVFCPLAFEKLHSYCSLHNHFCVGDALMRSSAFTSLITTSPNVRLCELQCKPLASTVFQRHRISA